jgi:hypothetical protein
VRSRLIIRPLSFTFLACNPGEDIGGLPPLPLPDEVATANEGLDSGLVPGETLPSEGGVIVLGGGVREEALGVTGESAVVEEEEWPPASETSGQGQRRAKGHGRSVFFNEESNMFAPPIAADTNDGTLETPMRHARAALCHSMRTPQRADHSGQRNPAD